MRISFFLLFFCLTATSAYSQKKMTIEDAVIRRYHELSPDRIQSLQWKDENTWVYTENDTLWAKTEKQNKPQIVLTTGDLNQASKGKGFSFSSFPAFSYTADNNMQIRHEHRLLLFDPRKKTFVLNLSVPTGAERLDFCEKTGSLAYIKGQNLYILSSEGEKQVTFESKPGIVCGTEVHRQEFGITKGTFWSETGKYLAFYRMDESMVRDYPLVDFMQREAIYKPVKYPMAGLTSHQVTVGVYHPESRKTVFLKTGTADDHYLTCLSWAPDDQSIYLAELNREQNLMQMNQYRTETGEKVKTLFRETSQTYVEPIHPIRFSARNPEQFYYWSRKDGWFHLYLYHISGKLVRQLTQGEWEVTGFYGTDKEEKNLFIQSTMENPVERHIYKVDLEKGKIQKLSREAGTHNASFSPGMKTFIDHWQALDVPSKTDLISAEGEFRATIHEAENPLSGYTLGENKLFTVKAADNKADLYCRLVLPSHFNPEKKYPVIVYVYGGPHVQLINNTWLNNADWWQYYMAENGYLVFTVDSRGSDNRGKAFEEIIHRQLGITETADQMKGIDYLKSLPYVDTDRIGVFGWSYGGFMTLNLKLRQPETFKVGVAGGPVVDWKMYEVMYGERYMDLPDENPEGYKSSDMTAHVNKLNGKLMLIHGAQDETVVMQHSMKFLRECIRQNKQVDFFAYPTHPHNVRGQDRLHLMTKISRYFFDYL
ncbi:MAG: DPP IV N-terminal domain-containing protein [Prolixibacteraceae bacterium]